MFEKLDTDSIFDVNLVVVDPSHRKMGLLAELLKRSLDLAKVLGFQGAKAEATGQYSKRALLRHGFEVVNEISYEDYDDPEIGKKVFANAVTPHKGAALVIKNMK